MCTTSITIGEHVPVKILMLLLAACFMFSLDSSKGFMFVNSRDKQSKQRLPGAVDTTRIKRFYKFVKLFGPIGSPH